MSSARFNRLIKDAHANDDKSLALQAFNEYQDTQCLHPELRRVYDAHTQTMRLIRVACGKCWHCQQTKINEWCTRMYAHAEDFKNVYFCTLTYRSFANDKNDVNRLMMSKLVQAVWNFDNFNKTKHLSYNPCLLVKSHYQNFLKRLRKNTGIDDLTYVLSGEYGTDYGRPHFHIIFFTNKQLTKDDVVRAWSVALWRKSNGQFVARTSQKRNGQAYNFPIGRVDFHDLVSNGTFNTTAKIKVDGTYMNAANCFSYVCKYVCKRDKANIDRVRMAYRKLFTHKEFSEFFGQETPLREIPHLIHAAGYPFVAQADDIFNHIKRTKYEKIIFQPCKGIFKHGLRSSRAFEVGMSQFFEEILPKSYHDFCNRFRPFCEFSRGTPIGSVYAKRNISEFTQGVFTKPLLQTSSFVVPSYFRSKARDFTYGLRKSRSTCKSKSIVLSGLVDLKGRLENALYNNSRLSESLPDTMDYQIIASSLQLDHKHFRNAYTGEKILIYNNHAQHYKYDRHTRSYRFTRAVPLSFWICSQLDALQDEMTRHDRLLRLSKDNLKIDEQNRLIMRDFGLDDKQLIENYEFYRVHLRSHENDLYHQVHTSIE